MLGQTREQSLCVVEQQRARCRRLCCFVAVSVMRRKRNDAQREPSCMTCFLAALPRMCPERVRLASRNQADFPGEFDECGGLKNRHRAKEKFGSRKC